ncbi:amidohydrolase [Siphonobacter sp. SORGH_AS_0500]|uniref:amidohydrolase family protein n=1 Tax=Siphonobacter sp. SORGH_AS_0500 TaxID=1864824 RepID=UPI000CC7B208|nr:amidohydrolase family protein [Siphonobacter sp. SORGH_AS_0500]MDR6194108.1 L-fuconolactonase [Siphonobacter sp. SORGH_AS_0500]PKK36919.1 amidohydrolase [Siphonobacter sp. SORGH_AS_0500]
MKIDSHQHFWVFDPVRDAWITSDMEPIRRNFLPNDLQPVLQQNNIDGCVAVQASQSEIETDFLIQLAEQNDFIKGVVGWVDLRSELVSERLEYFRQFPKLKGFRHIVQGEPDDLFLLRTEFMDGIRALETYGYTYDILIYPKHLPTAREFVTRLPHQLFVVDHLAKPYVKAGEIEKWAADIQSLAKRENVCCKVSGLVTEADWEQWTPEQLRPYLDVVFEAFGPERVMFGSDWPVCLVASSYERWVQVLQEYTGSLSSYEQEKFWGGNAKDFYSL